MIHESSDVKAVAIGQGTTIWQFCVVMESAVIGLDCNIGAHCFIENGVIVGDRVTIKNGVSLFEGIILEDDVFIGPNVTFTNDRFPKSNRGTNETELKFPISRICKGASIGGGATILPGITIGENALIGAGAVVTGDVPPNQIYFGVPAKHHRALTTNENF